MVLLSPVFHFPQYYEGMPHAWEWGCTFRRMFLRGTAHVFFTAGHLNLLEGL